MAKTEVNIVYTFSNPNTSKEFENLLKRILIEKLISQNNQICPGNY